MSRWCLGKFYSGSYDGMTGGQPVTMPQLPVFRYVYPLPSGWTRVHLGFSFQTVFKIQDNWELVVPYTTTTSNYTPPAGLFYRFGLARLTSLNGSLVYFFGPTYSNSTVSWNGTIAYYSSQDWTAGASSCNSIRFMEYVNDFVNAAYGNTYGSAKAPSLSTESTSNNHTEQLRQAWIGLHIVKAASPPYRYTVYGYSGVNSTYFSTTRMAYGHGFGGFPTTPSNQVTFDSQEATYGEVNHAIFEGYSTPFAGMVVSSCDVNIL